MLNTVMALWNQDHGENRRRIGKVIFTILFISGSLSLLLFTLNSSAWSPFAGAQEQQTKREEQPTMSNSRGILLAGNTPVDASGTVSITPTAPKVTIKPSCAQASAVAVPQKMTIRPQNVVTYSGKSDWSKGYSERKHAYPKTLRVKKGKPHPGNRSAVKVIAPPVSQATETVPVAPPVLPVATPTIQPTAASVATAEVIATTTPGDGTAVSNMPAIVTTGDNIPATSTTQFKSSQQQKGALQTSTSPLVKSDDPHGNVECIRSTTHEDNSGGGTTLKARRHVGLLLGSSLLGTLLLYCFAFVCRREGYSSR